MKTNVRLGALFIFATAAVICAVSGHQDFGIAFAIMTFFVWDEP